MTRRIGGATSAALLGICAISGLPGDAASQSNDWEVTVAPYGMLASLTGEVGISPGTATAVDLSFGDLVKNLEMAGMIHAEAWKGDWGIIADFVYLRLGNKNSSTFDGVVDIEVKEIVAEGLVGRRFEEPGRRIDVFAGVRFWDLSLDVELASRTTALNLGDSWIDPVAGGRIVQELSDAWFLMARGDIGGFGVGSSFTWNAQGGLGYEVSDAVSVIAQYRALSVDFDNEVSGLNGLTYDTTTHGPLFGVAFRF